MSSPVGSDISSQSFAEGALVRMKAISDATPKSTRVAYCSLKGTEQSARPDKVELGKKGGLQLPLCF